MSIPTGAAECRLLHVFVSLLVLQQSSGNSVTLIYIPGCYDLDLVRAIIVLMIIIVIMQCFQFLGYQ